MNTLSRAGLLEVLDAYLSDECEFASVRNYVFQLYEDEEVFAIDDTTRLLFAALAPYLEFEEASGDIARNERIQRLRRVLAGESGIAERVVFALEFPTIQTLTHKLESGIISRDVYLNQLAKLSPVRFDAKRIAMWARAHVDEPELNIEKIA